MELIQFSYLGGLLFSLGGLAFLDYTYKLAWFSDWRRTARTLGFSMLVFIVWDIIGIQLDIFFTGSTRYLTGWVIMPDLPIEEFFFLALLTYNTLILWRWFTRHADVSPTK